MVVPRFVSILFEFRTRVPVHPDAAGERGALWRLGDCAGGELLRELDAGVSHLSAGGDLQVAVAGETGLVAAAVGAEGFFGGDVAHAAVGQRDGEGVRE